jgi:hypothetical protein
MPIKSNDSNSHPIPWFWFMPNRSYIHPLFKMNFYWKLRMDCFATIFIFDEMRSFLPKEGMSWKKLISLVTRTHNCSFGPQSYTSSFTIGPWTILELLYPETKPLTPWAWSFSILLHHKAMLILDISEIFHLLCQAAASLTIIPGLTPFRMVVFGFVYLNIYAGLVVVFVH